MPMLLFLDFHFNMTKRDRTHPRKSRRGRSRSFWSFKGQLQLDIRENLFSVFSNLFNSRLFLSLVSSVFPLSSAICLIAAHLRSPTFSLDVVFIPRYLLSGSVSLLPSEGLHQPRSRDHEINAARDWRKRMMDGSQPGSLTFDFPS